MSFGSSPFDINSTTLKPKHFNAILTPTVTCGAGQRRSWNYQSGQYECVRDDGFRFTMIEDVETWVGYYRQNIINRVSGQDGDLTSARTTYGDRELDNNIPEDRILFQQQTSLTHSISDDRRLGDVTGQTQEQREYALSRAGIGEVTTRWWDAIGEATWRRNTFGDDPYDNQMFNDSQISSKQPIALNIGEMENAPRTSQPTLFQRYQEIQQTSLTHSISDDRRLGDVTGQTQEQREYALSRAGIGEVTTRWWDAIGEATWRRNTFGDDPYDNQMFNDSQISSKQPIALNIGEMENAPRTSQPTLFQRYQEIQQRVFREQQDTASFNEDGGYDFTYTPEEQSVIDEQTDVEDSYYDRVRAWYSANYSGVLNEDGDVRTNTGYYEDEEADSWVEGESTWIGDGEEPVFRGTGDAPEGRETAVTMWQFDVPAVQTVWCGVGDCDNPDSNTRRQLCWMGYDEYCDGDDSESMTVDTSVASDTSSTLQNPDDSQNLLFD